jgi:hypothetical protein
MTFDESRATAATTIVLACMMAVYISIEGVNDFKLLEDCEGNTSKIGRWN